MALNSILFAASGGPCCRFELDGKFLEILEKLPSGRTGQDQPTDDNPVCFRGLFPDGIVKADTCERYRDVAVYCANSDDLVGEKLFFVKRVFQWGSGGGIGHGEISSGPPPYM